MHKYHIQLYAPHSNVATKHYINILTKQRRITMLIELYFTIIYCLFSGVCNAEAQILLE